MMTNSDYKKHLIFMLIFVSPLMISPQKLANKYVVDLDKDPSERWLEIGRSYSIMIKDVNKIIRDYMPLEISYILEKLVDDFESYFDDEFISEIKGLATEAKCDPGELIIANIGYDVFAHCTSIVAQDSTGKVWHGRNLDCLYPDIFRNLTLDVEFKKANKTLFTVTTFAGYIGVLTGVKPNVFTISIDEREKGDPFWYNAVVALLDKKAKLIGMTARKALEISNTFDNAVAFLSNTDTFAPVYYILGGSMPNQGCVISRTRTKVDDLWMLDPPAGRWYLVETNYDHWLPPPSYDKRRIAAMKMLNATGTKAMSGNSLLKILWTPPLLRSIAIYTTVMSASSPPSNYSTWVWI